MFSAKNEELEDKKKRFIELIRANPHLSFESIMEQVAPQAELNRVIQSVKEDARKNIGVREIVRRHLYYLKERTGRVYTLICNTPGMTNKAISSELNLEESTVRRHLQDLTYIAYWHNIVGKRLKEHYDKSSRKERTESNENDLLKLIVEKPGLMNKELAEELQASEDTIGLWFKEFQTAAKTSVNVQRALKKHEDFKGVFHLLGLLRNILMTGGEVQSKTGLAEMLGISTAAIDRGMAKLRDLSSEYPEVRSVLDAYAVTRDWTPYLPLLAALHKNPLLSEEKLAHLTGLNMRAVQQQIVNLRKKRENNEDVRAVLIMRDMFNYFKDCHRLHVRASLSQFAKKFELSEATAKEAFLEMMSLAARADILLAVSIINDAMAFPKDQKTKLLRKMLKSDDPAMVLCALLTQNLAELPVAHRRSYERSKTLLARALEQMEPDLARDLLKLKTGIFAVVVVNELSRNPQMPVTELSSRTGLDHTMIADVLGALRGIAKLDSESSRKIRQILSRRKS